MTADFRFRRVGTFRPPIYSVETPSDTIGQVEACHASRRGANSRSANTYMAFPMNARGDWCRGAPLTVQESPDSPGVTPGGVAVFNSRREGAEALLRFRRAAGRGTL